MSTVAVDNASSAAAQISPAVNAALVTADDANDLTVVTRGISFATAGALKVTMMGDNATAGATVVIPSGALAAGLIHPLRVRRIWATGTTAASIVAYW